MRGLRSLIIAPQWIGDAVMTQPLLSELSRQGHELTVAALPWVAPVYEAMQECSKVMVLPFARGQLQWRLRREWAQRLKGQFDRAYVLPNSFKSALLVVGAGIKDRVGYLGEMRVGLLNHRLPNPSKTTRLSMVDFYLAMAHLQLSPGQRALVKPPHNPLAHPNPPSPHLRVEESTVQMSLTQFGLSPKGFIAVAPGAEYGEAKRWPKERYVELMASIQHPLVLLGSKADHALCEEMVQTLHANGLDHVFNLAGQTDLKQAMALIAAAKGLVSNDSGLMHVAAALGVPQIAIFGSSSPEHTPALSVQAKMIWLKWDPAYEPALACAPCFKRTCPLGHMRCLWDIPAERVGQLLQDW